MSERKWMGVSEDMAVAFSLPCREHYHYVRHVGNLGCAKPDKNHGHIELACEDGYCFVPFPCYSQAGVKVVIESFTSLSADERKKILALPEVLTLPQELTKEEKLVISSEDEMERLIGRSGFWM